MAKIALSRTPNQVDKANQINLFGKLNSFRANYGLTENTCWLSEPINTHNAIYMASVLLANGYQDVDLPTIKAAFPTVPDSSWVLNEQLFSMLWESRQGELRQEIDRAATARSNGKAGGRPIHDTDPLGDREFVVPVGTDDIETDTEAVVQYFTDAWDDLRPVYPKDIEMIRDLLGTRKATVEGFVRAIDLQVQYSQKDPKKYLPSVRQFLEQGRYRVYTRGELAALIRLTKAQKEQKHISDSSSLNPTGEPLKSTIKFADDHDDEDGKDNGFL